MNRNGNHYYKFIFATIFVIFSGCSNLKSKYYIKTVSGEFDDYKINQMFRNVLKVEQKTLLKVGEILPDEFVELNARHFKTVKGETYYSLIVVYRGDAPLNIIPKNSLLLLIDKELIKLDISNPDKRFVPKKEFRDRVWEEVSYKVEADVLKKMIEAKEVKIKILGEKREVICLFDEENFEAFRQFYKDYVK